MPRGAGLRPGAKAPDEPPDPNGGAPAPDPTYLPLLAFVTFDRESEQYLCAALLRHGKAVASEGTVGLLSRLLPLLRKAFPRARFLVRLCGFRGKPITDSGRNRSLIPIQTDHRFRSKPITFSRG